MISFLSDSYRKVKETQRKYGYLSPPVATFKRLMRRMLPVQSSCGCVKGGEKGEEGGSLFFATVKMAAFFGGQ